MSNLASHDAAQGMDAWDGKKENPVMELEVFVPSRSRWDRSLTLEALEGKWPRVTLVVPHNQRDKYAPLAKRHKVNMSVCRLDGIAATRYHIGSIARNKFLMLDDDLRFYRRLNKEDVRLYKFGEHDMAAMLILVSRLLDHYAHVAVSARGGNNQLGAVGYPWAVNKRPLRALAYRKWPFVACQHGRVSIMEDFDITLQLMAKGYQNVVITEFAQDQPQTQAEGGCSDYRTHKLHEDNVRKMAKLHPGLVKTRDKENKTGGEFGHRLEATIFWEKAWKQAMEEIL